MVESQRAKLQIACKHLVTIKADIRKAVDLGLAGCEMLACVYYCCLTLAIDLRKQFQREPTQTSVEAGYPVQLQCLPPEGAPLPEVFWLKDGEPIDPALQRNFIVSNEGGLILNQARHEDAGNYTCGAKNVAARRLTAPALLTIYRKTP